MKKKLCSLLLVLTMSLSLTACGGADTQPAIDAFNSATTKYDAVVNKINAELTAYPEELITVMNDLSDTLLEYKALLESGEELTEEQVTEMIQIFTEVEEWAVDTDSQLEEIKIVQADKQPAIDAYNRTSIAFNGVAEAINANLEMYAPELIEVMSQMSDSLMQLGALLDEDTMLTEEEVDELVAQLNDIEAWVADVEEEIAMAQQESEAEDIDLTNAIAYFNSVSTTFDETASVVRGAADSFSQDFMDTMSDLAEILLAYKELLEENYAFTEEEYNQMLQDLETIEQWLAGIEEDVFG